MNIGRAKLRDKGHPAGVYDLIEELDQGELSLGNIEAIITLKFPATELRHAGCTQLIHPLLRKQTGWLAGNWSMALQAASTTINGVTLKRNIFTEAIFCRQRPSTWSGCVDTNAIELDIFRILDEVLRQIPASRISGDRVSRRSTHAIHYTADIWQAAIVLHVIQADFGVVQSRHIPTHGNTKLILGIRFFVWIPNNGSVAPSARPHTHHFP